LPLGRCATPWVGRVRGAAGGVWGLHLGGCGGSLLSFLAPAAAVRRVDFQYALPRSISASARSNCRRTRLDTSFLSVAFHLSRWSGSTKAA
jgi:hypothetical protein